MTTPLIDRVRALGARAAALVAGLSEFQQRIWVVSIVHDAYTDTFIVNEGSFEEPMQWMHRKGYSAEMLARVEAMARSQVVQLEFGGQRHRLMRVK
ncbi:MULTISPECIES: hypothetical protein [Aeromonas]|uniref:hypothetical protein n=1 Tax=Aeromonas TaxID=642 RepID=UPI0005C194BA|nr:MULTISPECIES: hypothetical protein [Aeromonas]QXB54586.1 hypothetical protein I6L45_18870 [Aeromonas sp. FDAARGOS 1415]